MKDLSKKINKTPCLKFFTFLLDIESKAKTSAFLNNLLVYSVIMFVQFVSIDALTLLHYFY